MRQSTRFGKLPEEIERADGSLMRMLELETLVAQRQRDAMREAGEL